MARLKETYLNEIVDAMMKKFEYKKRYAGTKAR